MTRFLKTLVLAASLVFTVAADAARFRTVIIDAGHGGHDNGGQWGKVYEKHLALDTALRLEALLKKQGYRVVMTRRDDYFVTLQERVRIANSHRDAIFVSIHFNYTWKHHVSGGETFYFNTEGQKLAGHVQNEMVSRTGKVDRRAKFARYFVIRNTRLPAILVEGGFVTNAREREAMKSGPFRQSIAEGIAEGIKKYRSGR